MAVIYDSDADDSDPHPRLAFIVGGHIVKSFNGIELAPRGGGFERYLSSCEFNLGPNEKAFAIVLSSGYDGAASAFSIIRWQSGKYRVVFNRVVGPGRMEFGVGKFELWSVIWGKVMDPKSDDFGNYECVWCPHHYLVTEYLWRDGKYIKADSRRTKGAYDATEISGTSLLIKAQLGTNE